MTCRGSTTHYYNAKTSNNRKIKKKELADKPGSVSVNCDSHSSRMFVAEHLKQPTREQCGPHLMFPYLVLLRVGFTLPCLLPDTRCALTAPFHPYQLKAGGIFSVALSVGSRLPGVTWHSVLWSPDFPPRINIIQGDCLANSEGNYTRLCMIKVCTVISGLLRRENLPNDLLIK